MLEALAAAYAARGAGAAEVGVGVVDAGVDDADADTLAGLAACAFHTAGAPISGTEEELDADLGVMRWTALTPGRAARACSLLASVRTAMPEYRACAR